MAKVLCESCGSSFLYDVVKDMKVCPVCGKTLWESDAGKEEGSTPKETLSFGEGIELGENDSFDEDKIDFWWYNITEPTATDEGYVSVVCKKCNRSNIFLEYPIARAGDYLLINSQYRDKCYKCGNPLKNHIISKRPAGLAGTREENRWSEDIPKCPICGSANIHKISMTNKAVSALAFGVFAAGHVSKTFKCDACGAKF